MSRLVQLHCDTSAEMDRTNRGDDGSVVLKQCQLNTGLGKFSAQIKCESLQKLDNHFGVVTLEIIKLTMVKHPAASFIHEVTSAERKLPETNDISPKHMPGPKVASLV